MDRKINGRQYEVVLVADPITGEPVSPAGGGGGGGAGSDRELVVSTYRAKNAFSGASVGDTITCTQVLDVTSTPTQVATIWRNQTTAANLGSAPAAADLELVGSNALTDAQLRATPVPVDDAAIGSTNDVAASTDTGNFTLISLFKRLLQSTTSLVGRLPSTLFGGRLGVNANNFSLTFRESFVAFPGTDWNQVALGTGDIVGIDGNSAGASYLVLSKNPLDLSGGESMIESTITFQMPLELAVGAHLSQRVVGQELSVEVVSTETPDAEPAELAISSIQQATTTLTVTTATPHGLRVGSRISIYGVTSDSRLNYSELVVATTPSTTQFTCTAGPMGTIASVTSGPFAQGFVYIRSSMARAPNGTSMIFEQGSATQASFYSKSDNGDPMPIGGTIGGSHSVTVASTASIQPAAAFNNYNFRPTSEFRLAQMADRLQWHDVGVDATGQTTARATITQVIPNNARTYKLRFRGKNHRALTAPVAKIVSATKTGTATATIVTDVAHGLTTGDVVNIYGIRDQAAASFPNLTAATPVASVVNATTFTIVIGTASTVTSYGGYVSRVNGGQTQQGAITQAVQSASITGSILTLVGSAAWSGLLIGDYVNLHGCRDNSPGADMGLDAVYRVRDIQTTNLVLEQIAGTAIPASLGSTNCGGAIIRRTDMRISFVRLFDFDRLRVETLNRPTNDAAGAMPVQIANTPAVTVSSGTVTTVTAANLNIPGTIADVASAAITSTATVAAITPTFGTEYEVNIPVTAVSGTTPTMDVVVQESDDGGTNWYDVYHFPRITAIGMYRSPKLPLKGNRVRYVQTIAGTTPSFTRAINRLQGSFTGTRWIRRIFDRAVSLTTLNAATTTAAGNPLNVQECSNVQLVINLGAATTPPQLQLEGSDDNGVSWYALGAPLAGAASSTVQLTVNNVNAEFVRARVSTVGATVTAGYVEVKAWS